ncbi:N-acetylmuramoyl-L-alanine amidase [uncultured Selenomonas sp.]|uniref:peptidoglycan recognition protein family protein n=1 Tax=uncultured Selenomonas sp. TaxID=159275 RepID=UPI0028D0CF5C|nr:N-acetylmuramoyl-L-alanine amidase [uncultured Selenomonas sp.]
MSNTISKSAMRKMTPAELENLAMYYREEIQHTAEQVGRETKIYLHWSAGHYGQFFADYHVQIDKDGAIYVIGDGVLDEVLAATWKRNSGSISICILGCYGADTNSLGAEPPTHAQIERMAQAIAALSNGLWLTIDKQRVMTHGEAADNEDGIYPHDPYGPKNGCERWDLEYLGTMESPTYHPWAEDGMRGGDVLRGKANWYRRYWKEQGGTPND